MHAFLDKYSVAMTALLLKDRWFNSSVTSLGFQKQIEETAVVLPEFEYDVKTITVIDKGHITGALASEELRAHILGRLG